MRKIFLALGILSMGLLTSCQMEEYTLEGQPNAADAVVTASLGDMPETRTEMERTENGFKVLWSAQDEISLFTSNTAHSQWVLSNGAGSTRADFKFVAGEMNFSTEQQREFMNVSVYPYNENTTVVKEGDDYLINTEIPVYQSYGKNSFGQGASPMVAVDATLDFAFKNVGSFLVMPLYGTEIITYATLESKSHTKLAGAVTITAAAAEGWLPMAEVSERGSDIVEMSCGEGVQLSETEATNFTFVLAPGTYAANDLVIRFYDTVGNFFETEITAENTFTRSKSRTFSARTFEVSGTKAVDLWIRAKAGAYMDGERIIPCVTNLNIEEWINNLKAEENIKMVIEEAVAYLAMKNYKAAYEVLGGIPGFTKDVKRFEAYGSFIQKVDYTGMSYLQSMLDDLELVNDIPSLLNFLSEFEKIYQGTGIQGKLDAAVDEMLLNIDTLIDNFINGNNKLEEPEYDTQDAIDAFKRSLNTKLTSSISTAKSALSTVDAYVENIDEINAAIEKFNQTKASIRKRLEESQFSKYFTALIAALQPTALLEAEDVADMQASLNDFVVKAEQLQGELDSLNDVAVIKEKVNALPKIKVQFQTLVPDLSLSIRNILASVDMSWLKNIPVVGNLAYAFVENLFDGNNDETVSGGNYVIDFEVDPTTFLGDATDAYNSIMDQISNNLNENSAIIAAARAALNTAIQDIRSKSLVEVLEGIVADPTSLSSRFLTYIFSQETFLNMVKESLRTIVTEIEDASKDLINGENVDLKRAAILAAKTNALIEARVEALTLVENSFNATNEANIADLYNGPWGIFKKLLNWNTCIELFEKARLLQVYDALIDLIETVEEMVAYDEGLYYYHIENLEDYQEDVDWWVISANEMF